MRLQLDRKKEWSRHTFEVATEISVIKETTWSRPNAYVMTRKQTDQQFWVATYLKAQDSINDVATSN